MEDDVPRPGHWPIDPQEDQEVLKDRIWVDGCFDFAHHGISRPCNVSDVDSDHRQATPEHCFRPVNEAESSMSACTPIRPFSKTRVPPL